MCVCVKELCSWIGGGRKGEVGMGDEERKGEDENHTHIVYEITLNFRKLLVVPGFFSYISLTKSMTSA